MKRPIDTTLKPKQDHAPISANIPGIFDTSGCGDEYGLLKRIPESGFAARSNLEVSHVKGIKRHDEGLLMDEEAPLLMTRGSPSPMPHSPKGIVSQKIAEGRKGGGGKEREGSGKKKVTCMKAADSLKQLASLNILSTGGFEKTSSQPDLREVVLSPTRSPYLSTKDHQWLDGLNQAQSSSSDALSPTQSSSPPSPSPSHSPSPSPSPSHRSPGDFDALSKDGVGISATGFKVVEVVVDLYILKQVTDFYDQLLVSWNDVKIVSCVNFIFVVVCFCCCSLLLLCAFVVHVRDVYKYACCKLVDYIL